MHPYSHPHEPDVKAPSQGGYEPDYTRSAALRAALSYAARGKPVFPTRHHDDPDPTRRKAPLTPHGLKDATTDASRVHAFWTRHIGASIGVVAGEESGWWILDVDRLQALDELGLELPPTLTVRTPSGGLHLYFRHDPRIVGNGRGRLPQGIDVRGGGRGYALIPPSPGYRWEVREEIAQAPEKLIAMIAEPKKPTPRPRRNDRQPTLDLDGPAILEGERHSTMLSMAGRLHDGTGTADDLHRDLLAVNTGRCVPPLEVEEVTAIAHWIYEREPCAAGRPPELGALVGRLSEAWYGMERRGTGGKNEARFARVLLEAGDRIGTVVEDGLRVSLSIRQAAELLSCRTSTVTALRDRMVEKGLVRYDRSEVGKKNGSGAFVMLARRDRDTISDSLPSRPIGDGVTGSARPTAANLETAHYRHMGPVGYAGEDVLAHVEAHPGGTRDELAALLGVARPRDLERRRLRPLAALGLIEETAGRWSVSDRYAEAQQDTKKIAYSTIQMRSARQMDPESRRWVHFVAETGSVASQETREKWDIERHRQQRALWKLALAEKKDAAEEAAQPGRVVVEANGYLVDAETGEVLGDAVRSGWDADETSDRTEAA